MSTCLVGARGGGGGYGALFIWEHWEGDGGDRGMFGVSCFTSSCLFDVIDFDWFI